jgi:hypothetical protein
VQVSPSCFERRTRAVRLLGDIGIGIALLMLASACVTVRPEEKELLADPSMLFDSAAMARRHEEHALENREGSFGGGSARGSGCGCN